MRYRIDISDKAREQLRALPKEIRRNIGHRIEAMRDDLRGDVLKLRDKGNRYRLRIGTYRVLFVLAGDVIRVMLSKIERKVGTEMRFSKRSRHSIRQWPDCKDGSKSSRTYAISKKLQLE